jgi:hypothetical protein
LCFYTGNSGKKISKLQYFILPPWFVFLRNCRYAVGQSQRRGYLVLLDNKPKATKVEVVCCRLAADAAVFW